MGHEDSQDAAVLSGFGAVDSRGRLTLTKPVRETLGLRAGSTVAYVAVDDRLLIIPQDAHLARLGDDAVAALAHLGLTADDLLADLPAAGEAAMRRSYGDGLVDELTALHGHLRSERAGE